MSWKQSLFLKSLFARLPAAARLKCLRVIERSWYDRIRLTLSSGDNAFIHRVPDAGRVEDGVLTMHNGLHIHRGSYYGETMSVLLELNQGVHEPQEERVFQEVMKVVPAGGAMLELGAYWAFYSMWFARTIPRAKCILVEPDLRNLEFGRANFALNGLEAAFLRGYAGSAPAGDPTPVFTVDELMERYGWETLHVLHADIQGAELDMLGGAEKSFAHNAVDFVFVSTHSNELHRDCLRFLTSRGFFLISEAGPSESFSEDGVIVAKRKGITEPGPIAISRRVLR